MDYNWIDQSIYSAFKATAEKYPHNEALVNHQTVLNYRQLLQQVDQYAFALSEIAAGNDTPIAIWLPNDYRFIICMLAVNSLGKAYLPLDYSFPKKRNLEILAHSGCTIVISNTSVPKDNELSLQYIDVTNLASSKKDQNHFGKAAKDSLSYIIYTSGSTGRPKGVYQNQTNTLHDVRQYIDSIHLNSTDRCTLFYSPAVSGAIRDIYGSLLTGATLCMANLKSEGISIISDFIIKHRITVYHSLPGIFRAFLLREEKVFETVRLVYLAGDRILTSDFELFKKHFNSLAQLYVGIGSTENATIYCQWLLNHATKVDHSLLPLGHMVPDRSFKLLDENNQEVPLGHEGEISVTSRYMALGYWNDPELSTNAFISNTDGSRTFKTGDMAKLLANGMLHFLGRADKQVKIDGYRIEVDEVSEKIKQVAGVSEACIIVHRTQENNRLIAFLVLEEEQSISIQYIKEQLKQLMPTYMVPSSLIILQVMPLLDNFKVDYHQLNDIYQTRVKETNAIPEKNAGLILRSIWLKYIDNPLSYDANLSFYEAGGSSIDVVYMAVELEKYFNIEIPAHTIHSSLKPSVISQLVLSGIRNRTEKDGVIPYKIYLFSPFRGLSTDQINLVKSLASFYEIKIIQYPNKTNLVYESILDKNASTVIEEHFSKPNPNAIYLGVCNGNYLACAVAARLPIGYKPLLHINIDSPKPCILKAPLTQRIVNAVLKIKKHGFKYFLYQAIPRRILWLKNYNTKLYLIISEQLKKRLQLGDTINEFYIVSETKNLSATQIPLLFFAGTELADLGINNSYGWSDKYSRINIEALPYAHQSIIADDASRNFIIARIVSYLNNNTKLLSQKQI